MCRVTKYCNVIGLHYTERRDIACLRSSLDPSLVLWKWVWLARLCLRHQFIDLYLREILLTILEPLLTSASVSLNCVCGREGGREGGIGVVKQLGHKRHTSVLVDVYKDKTLLMRTNLVH